MIVVLTVALLGGLVGGLGMLRRDRPARSGERGAPDVYPESLTAVLGRGEEEYLAWLAYHHWPEDEYLALEEIWCEEIEAAGDQGPVATVCPRCRHVADDLWPCRTCGRTLHATCGHGMHRRPLARPYRTPDMGTESVTAEWLCTGCRTVIGLDVDQEGGEADGDVCR